MSEKVQGTLVIIGGAEDKTGERVILRRFVELAGGERARLVVVTSATSRPQLVGDGYSRLFKDLGVQEVSILNVASRQEANIPSAYQTLLDATGIFFTGGDQLRITSLLGGTRLDEALRKAYREGTIIAGTSAGASAMSETMIVEGDGERAPQRNNVKMAPGLGLIREVVVDQHFAQRGRLGRLLTAVAQHPYMLGIGIDEDTAIVVKPGGVFEVIGSQTVTVIDGKQIQETNVSESGPLEPLALTNVILHILPVGYKFDMIQRQPLSPA
ncbi:MAG TPA: cyanophycinase [Syntrophomonadaceae bacterium]|nr:cyanophycinase [Syntrophomonadaceae bacterium]